MTVYDLIQDPTSAKERNYHIAYCQHDNVSRPLKYLIIDLDFNSNQEFFKVDFQGGDLEIDRANITFQYFEEFSNLKAIWSDETAHLSSILNICTHLAYQKIIGMGKVAVPFILSSMREEPNHWFWALKSITGDDPVLPEHRGDVFQMTEAWLAWGKEHGYISE